MLHGFFWRFGCVASGCGVVAEETENVIVIMFFGFGIGNGMKARVFSSQVKLPRL